MFLHYLYNYGYQKFKPTPIIKELQSFFFFLGIFLVFRAFIPLIGYNTDYLTDDFLAKNIAVILLVVVGIYLTRFRRETLREKPKNNPLLGKE